MLSGFTCSDRPFCLDCFGPPDACQPRLTLLPRDDVSHAAKFFDLMDHSAAVGFGLRSAHDDVRGPC